MMIRKLLGSALAAATFAAIPLAASADFGVYLGVAPPAPRYEYVPAPRPGWVWAPGYWDWRYGRYVWVPGRWVRRHPGMYWHPDRWQYRDGGWVLERGGWHRHRWDDERFAERDHERWEHRDDRGRWERHDDDEHGGPAWRREGS